MSILAIPSDGNGGLKVTLYSRFGRCESITIISIEKSDITSVKTVTIHPTEAVGNLGIHVANVIINNEVTDVILNYIGYKAFHLLTSHKIKIFQAPIKELTVKQSLELFIEGKLPELKEPNAHLINK